MYVYICQTIHPVGLEFGELYWCLLLDHWTNECFCKNIFFSLYRHSLTFVYNCKDKNAAIKNLINEIKKKKKGKTNRNIFEMDKVP